MDTSRKIIIAGLFLIFIIGGAIIFGSLNTSKNDNHQDKVTPYPTLIGNNASISGIPTESPGKVLNQSPSVTKTARTNTIHARIDAVDTSHLALGKPSSAYITITNTGDIPITKERIEITAGKNFGPLIGYQSQIFIQEFHSAIKPGNSSVLEEQFNFPSTEAFVSLEGTYDVTVRVYANDWYHLDDWTGKISLND
jgi:hypothetical protein